MNSGIFIIKIAQKSGNPVSDLFHFGGSGMRCLGELASVLQSGDVVYTVSCNRFASVRQVYTFARFCHERGIVLHFVAEPYLDMGNGKQWRPAVAKVIASMVESEQKAKGMMAQGFKMTDSQ